MHRRTSCWQQEMRARRRMPRLTLRADPKNPQLHYNLSLALDQLGDRATEHQELEKAIQLDPELAVAHNQLGVLALQGNRTSEAEQEFKKAIAGDPRYAEAQNNLGVLYNREGKDQDAATLYQRAIDSDSKYTKALVNLVCCSPSMARSLKESSNCARPFRSTPAILLHTPLSE